MADTTEGDTNVLDLGLLVLALIALIAGLLIHSFIIGVNVSDWWRGRSVTPVDLIVTALGISRICGQCSDMLYLFVEYLLIRNLFVHVMVVIIGAFYTFFTYGNFWLTSLLSIVLRLKISNLHTRLFMYLRRMISHRTGRLIVGSLLLSAVTSFIPMSISISMIYSNETIYFMMNELFIDCTYDNPINNYIAGIFLPLVLYCISSVLLFFSLYHHTTRMKRSSNLSINLETYYSAMKLVSFTFLYNTSYFIGHFVGIYYFYFYCIYFTWLYMILDFLPVLHSSYLIYRTTRLRNQMSEVLRRICDFLLHSKDTETRENIEIGD